VIIGHSFVTVIPVCLRKQLDVGHGDDQIQHIFSLLSQFHEGLTNLA